MRINLTEAIKRYILSRNWESIRAITSITLANIAVIGFGLGLYEKRITATIYAAMAFVLGALIAGGTKK